MVGRIPSPVRCNPILREDVSSGASRPRTPASLYTGLGGYHLGGIVDPFSLIFDDFIYFGFLDFLIFDFLGFHFFILFIFFVFDSSVVC